MELLNFFAVSHPLDIGTGLILFFVVACAIGDYISYKTRAIFSMMFVSSVVVLIAFWLGLPKDIFKRSGLDPIVLIVMPFILVQMGTLMKIKELISEWKTVLIALLGLVALTLGLYYLAGPVIGEIRALAVAGPISGGIVATLIVREAAELKGLTDIVVLTSLLLALQQFVGLPIASFCLKQESKRLSRAFREAGGKGADSAKAPEDDPEVPTFRVFPATPKPLQTTFVLMFKAFLIAYLGIWLSALMGGFIHKYMMCLFLGIVFYELGFLEHNIMTKANIMGYAVFYTMIVVFMGLPNATPQMVYDLAYPMVISFAITVVALTFSSLILGKILGYSWALSMAISVTCMIGFPGTYIVSDEVTSVMAENSEEKEHLMAKILPKMLIGGFTTVTIGSVILAGYLVKIIAAMP